MADIEEHDDASQGLQGEFTYTVDNVWRLDGDEGWCTKAVTSPVHYIGGLPWSVTLHIRGTSFGPDYLTIHLDCDHSQTTPWECPIEDVKYGLLHTDGRSVNYVSGNGFWCNDFGSRRRSIFLSYFRDFDDLMTNADKHFVRENGSIVVWVFLKLKYIRGVDFLSKPPPYAGLEDPSYIGLMNSLLQVLFFLRPFRKAVNELNLNSTSSSFLSAIQRLFLELQSSRGGTVSIRDFLEHAPWKLFDKALGESSALGFIDGLLEELAKDEEAGITLKTVIQQLFDGKLQRSTNYRHLPFATVEHPRSFRGLVVPVQRFKNLGEFIRDFTRSSGSLKADEKLVDGNIPSPSPETTTKVDILDFPTVLFLELNSGQNSTNASQKQDSNESHGFGYSGVLNAKEFLKPSSVTSDRQPGSWRYLLLAIIHKRQSPFNCEVYNYSSLIDVTGGWDWVNFSDETVEYWPFSAKSKEHEWKKAMGTSCLLVYVRETAVAWITTERPGIKRHRSTSNIEKVDSGVSDDESSDIYEEEEEPEEGRHEKLGENLSSVHGTNFDKWLESKRVQ